MVSTCTRGSPRACARSLLGEYQAAALLAMREVEIRVRDLANAGNDDLGVALMKEAFERGGPLADPALEAGEQHATMALFRGAIGVFKNPSSHRQVDYEDPTLASQIVLFADLLHRMLDRAEAAAASKRPRPQPAATISEMNWRRASAAISTSCV